MIKIFGINNCTSVRNAIKFFERKKIVLKYIDLRKEKPKWNEMQKIKNLGKFKIIDLFNSNGKVFISMGLGDTINTFPEEDALKLLVTDALLFKRPLVIDTDKKFVRTGWNKKEYEEKWF